MGYSSTCQLPNKDEEQNLDFEIFLTPPQNLEEAQHRFVEFDERHAHELSKRQYSRLLFIHEHTISDLLNTLHLWEIIQTKPPMSVAKKPRIGVMPS
jgi:hypothetical protein